MPTDFEDVPSSERNRKCDSCYKSRQELDGPLLQCSRCRMASYCSKDCQRNDWKSHRTRCNHNFDHAASLKETDTKVKALGINWQVPDNVSLMTYDTMLEEWIRVYSLTMCDAAIHACKLMDDVKRCRSHVLHVTLNGRTKNVHKGKPKAFFEVESAVARTIKEAKTLGGAWKEGLEAMEDQRNQVEAMGGQEMVIIVVEAPPLGVQFAPVGSIPNLKYLKFQANWEETLKSRVAKGLPK